VAWSRGRAFKDFRRTDIAIIGTPKAPNADDHYVPTLEVAKVMIKAYFEHHHGQIID
jgi:hypothetical protein